MITNTNLEQVNQHTYATNPDDDLERSPTKSPTKSILKKQKRHTKMSAMSRNSEDKSDKNMNYNLDQISDH